MRVLDLFCCGGGGARGYARAGLEVVGVDNVLQIYPYEFHQADAIEYLLKHGKEFDLIHASPPCQGYSLFVSSEHGEPSWSAGRSTPRLIEATRNAARAVGVPYIIENVEGARFDMRKPITLCGSMFGLPIPRHRLFETSLGILPPLHPVCRGLARASAEARGWDYRDMRVSGKGRGAGCGDRWKELLGIGPNENMSQSQLRECIPPAFTHYLGTEAQRIIREIRQRAGRYGIEP